ncbi:MAG TPA: methyltransferase [Chitinophagaceae bacterium]|nr:methyltransferase [Chitinophagaceae bacterium]
MANTYFQFKQFIVHQDRCAMKVTTDACLFGAWAANQIINEKLVLNNTLDIGTGTGLLSLMIAQKNDFPIDAIEIDKDASEQAMENAAASPWKERIKIFRDDARDFAFPRLYDVIISNPPFYENDLPSEDPKTNLALHSEKLSLDELLKVISSGLSPDGIFFLLLPYKRKDEIRMLFKEHNLDLLQIIFVKQSFHHDYFRIMLKGKLKTAKQSVFFFDEISIWNEKRQYTDKFRNLLRDYYLYL